MLLNSDGYWRHLWKNWFTGISGKLHFMEISRPSPCAFNKKIEWRGCNKESEISKKPKCEAIDFLSGKGSVKRGGRQAGRPDGPAAINPFNYSIEWNNVVNQLFTKLLLPCYGWKPWVTRRITGFVLLMFQWRLPFLPVEVSSNLTFKGFPQYRLPSSAAIAALASWPSIPIKPKPRHLPLNISEISWMERTLPYSENKAWTVSSVASLGKFPTKIRFKRHVLNSGGELIDRASRIMCRNPAHYVQGCVSESASD